MPWGIRQALARRFPHPAALAADAAHTGRLTTYLTDLLAPYDLALRDGGFTGQSYGDMAASLIADLGAEVDALVLAYDIPDVTPGRATATWLSHVCPGDPMAFAVSDQGRAAAHTGLRLLHDYARTGTYERALLLIVEQAELPYDPGVPVATPAAHAGVALLLGPSTVEAAAPRILAGAEPGDAAAELAALAPDTVILGGPLADVDVKAGEVLHADPAQPMTGVWSALAEAWTPGAGRIAVADYDPALRYLCVSTFGS
ncbi:hypothetical protein GCM10010399_35600 [Dactylosporangium fulvum]|uniref:2-hydroxy-acid oxidase n=1 Tax=Dactylosporangium fulvum TaxID=53359 RepID=A0ABY5W7H3_9ACTN|nr:2-hydroxy-acid oxidase [Dactylosporangium fulvum]UWP84974.1 2-hydroxy-acid oxidase [Dactylosporangium fulvum]